MKHVATSSSARIKSNPRSLVKGLPGDLLGMACAVSLVILFCCALESRIAKAEDIPGTPSTQAPGPSPSPLPDIEAKAFDVKVVRTSTSKKTYLFDDPADSKPRTGRILLLKKGDDPVMAFRVLKTYPSQKQFAGKRVRTYGSTQILEPSSEYRAIEKISDIVPVPETAQDKKDLKELEAPMPAPPVPAAEPPAPTAAVPEEPPAPAASTPPVAAAPPSPPTSDVTRAPSDEMPPDPTADLAPPVANTANPNSAADAAPPTAEPAQFDNELDSGSASNEKGKKPLRLDEDPIDEGEEANEGPVSADEVTPLDGNKHWLSIQGGWFRNRERKNSVASYSQLNTGMGLRYGISLGRMMLLYNKAPQDSLVLEGSFYLYKVLGYVITDSKTAKDAYTLMPTSATLRYNILFDEDLGIFFYGGVTKNWVISSAQATASGISELGGILPSVGAGLLFRIGPNWQTRVDLGYDLIGVGLVLRF